jgi:hypothetical protein
MDLVARTKRIVSALGAGSQCHCASDMIPVSLRMILRIFWH